MTRIHVPGPLFGSFESDTGELAASGNRDAVGAHADYDGLIRVYCSRGAARTEIETAKIAPAWIAAEWRPGRGAVFTDEYTGRELAVITTNVPDWFKK